MNATADDNFEEVVVLDDEEDDDEAADKMVEEMVEEEEETKTGGITTHSSTHAFIIVVISSDGFPASFLFFATAIDVLVDSSMTMTLKRVLSRLQITLAKSLPTLCMACNYETVYKMIYYKISTK